MGIVDREIKLYSVRVNKNKRLVTVIDLWDDIPSFTIDFDEIGVALNNKYIEHGTNKNIFIQLLVDYKEMMAVYEWANSASTEHGKKIRLQELMDWQLSARRKRAIDQIIWDIAKKLNLNLN